jgi:RimJ/RimL family protein N-acetyltransferase
MAYGPKIEAIHNDGIQIVLREPENPEFDLAPFFPTPEQVSQYTVGRIKGYLGQETPADFIANVLDNPQLVNWGLYAGDAGNDGPRLVGTAGVHEPDEHGRSWFYTYLLDPNYHGQRFGRRASRLVVAAAFVTRPALEEIVTFVNPANEPGLKVAEYIGMAPDAEYAGKQRRFTVPREATWPWLRRAEPHLSAQAYAVTRALGGDDAVIVNLDPSAHS